MRSLYFVVCLAMVACDGPARTGSTSRSPRSRRDPMAGIDLVPMEVGFSGPAARRYGAGTPRTPTATEAVIGRQLAEAGLRSDAALHRAARELARTAPDRANFPSGLIDGVMAWAGVTDPPPSLVVVELPEDPAGCHARYSAACQPAVSSLLNKLELPRSDPPPRFGVGVAGVPDGRTLMVVAVVEPMVELAPMPTSLAARTSLQVRGRLVGPRADPSVYVVDPSGHGAEISTTLGQGNTFAAQVTCAARGRYQVEVMAEGAHGPEVAANFPVYCAQRSPTRLRVELERLQPGVSAGQIARANFEYLNAERKRRGLEPVSWDDRAARVAQAHSEDMLRGRFVGHVSPRTGDVSRRFERAKIVASVVRENVARGYGPKGVHDSLMGSPGHRVNLLADDVSHVGIGVVVGPRDDETPEAPRALYVTQNFFKKPGAGAPRDTLLAPTVRARVDGIRKQRRLGAVPWDDGLDKVAAMVASRLAANRRLPSGWEQEVFDLGYGTVETNRIKAPDFDQLAGVDLWLTPQLVAGMGVARISDARGGGFVMVVLVVSK